MKFTILLAVAALLISGVSAYFSIVGLAAIFAASRIPIIIMGTVVELGKIVTVAWLHYDWGKLGKRIKYGLTIPVIGVMILTSVGVFGFLSKAHVEQTAAADESIAQVERIEKEVGRLESIIDRAELKITDLESGTLTVDTTTQQQIDKEQERIDSAYERIQPAIDEQNAIITSQTQIYEDQIATIDAELAKLQEYIDNGEIEKAQQLIGEKSPGGWGPKTTATANKWRAERRARKASLLDNIEEVTRNNPNIIAARKEIQRLRGKAEQQIADSNELINRLRDKIANSQRADNTDELLDAQYARINKANVDIEKLTDEKYELEAEYRQLEAEVGPIKYIAESIYGEDADRDLLEKAVKWVIVLLLLVLDPFAVMLVMAATDRYRLYKEELKNLPENATQTEIINDLKKKLEEVKKQETSLYNVIEERNKEMNTLREEAQTEINSLKEHYSDYDQLVVALEDMELALEKSERDRADLQEKLDNTIGLSEDDANIIQELINQRDELDQELKALNEKILDPNSNVINIQEVRGNNTQLRHKVAVLEERIKSMAKLSDFDLLAAQELVETKDQVKKLEVQLATITQQNERYKKILEKGE